jgi:hypothetical protein
MLGESLQNALRLLIVAPKIIGGGLSLKPRDFLLPCFEVKGPSAAHRVVW